MAVISAFWRSDDIGLNILRNKKPKVFLIQRISIQILLGISLCENIKTMTLQLFFFNKIAILIDSNKI